MAQGKRTNRIVGWPSYDAAASAKAAAASEDCRLQNRLTVWRTYEQAAAHADVDEGGGGDEGSVTYNSVAVTYSGEPVTYQGA